ncbi:hypothetical protein FW774_02520 (plasmid) [Pedobacter sp. BS3]|uniref:HmuY family protein n=1 Tax=Pedobacter sp. BS3 TaxID=2567937 RepID=UPI0011EE013D|nr:HmuY family protein [Pedobacter sp. BS3]TZF85955.1 hypothetical protein FW774_02520 [Pedobacter sp. BS3]
MNKFRTLALVLIGSVTLLAACSKDKDDAQPEESTLTVNQVNDLDGSAGDVYYSLSTNSQVTGNDIQTNKWDLKFSGTTIYVNSGTSGPGTTQAQVVNSTFADLTVAPTSGYKSDSATEKAITGWYNYTNTTEPQHAILMVPGKIIVVKTSTGKYAKLEMQSYYLGNPDTTTSAFADLATRPKSKVYTFRFVYQADGTTNLK